MLASAHCPWLGGEGMASRNHRKLLSEKCRERHVATADISKVKNDQSNGILTAHPSSGRLDGEDLEGGLALSMSEEVHFFEYRRRGLPRWNPGSATSCPARIWH